MKILGWVLLVGGLIAAGGAYQYSYGGTAGIAVMVVVAAVGLWLVLKKDDGMPPMPGQM